MVINSSSLETLACKVSKYAEACGVKSILKTKPPSLNVINIKESKLCPLPKDIVQLGKNISHRVTEEQIPEITKELLLKAKTNYNDFVLHMENIFKDLPGKLIYGIKPEKSINKKLCERIDYFNCYNEELSWDMIMQEAQFNVPDLIRARFILNKGSKKEVDTVMEAISKAVDKGDLKLGKTFIYGSKPYTNYALYKNLIAQGEGGCSLVRKESNYTGTHFQFINKKGDFLFELQLRGPEVDKVANKEHAGYRKFRHAETQGKTFSPEEEQAYKQTIKYWYKNARAKELKS